MRSFDVVIVGSGSAGQTVAAACAQAGRSVAMVERDRLGGTCALRGCQPKKLLMAAAEAVAASRRLTGRGIVTASEVDWPALMAHKRAVVEAVPKDIESWLTSLGVELLMGDARFVGLRELEVSGSRVQGESIVLATGAKPVALGFQGADLVSTSTDFLDLDTMPKRICFIGGGYISFELAWLAQTAGAQVTIAHRSSDALKGFDPWLSAMLVEAYRGAGIDVLLDAPVTRVRREDRELVVEGDFEPVRADAVFHGAGRVPDLDRLDLQAGGVAYTPRGVSVEPSLRSVSNPAVWAAGDSCAVGAPLTPVAARQGEVVSAGILGSAVEFDGSVTPSVAFTNPPIALVGLGARDVEKDPGLELREFDMSTWFSQARLGNDAAGARLVIERDTGIVRGAHLLGLHAEEIINVLAVVVATQRTVSDLQTMTWTYPTAAYEINYLVERWG